MLDWQRPERIPPPTAAELSDHSLIAGARAGDEDAAKHLYFRYAKRLTSLVKRQCSPGLARCAGVEDIVQSVFGTFFRRIGQGCYQIPDGDTIWKMLLVIAMNRVRTQAAYHYAAKRDARRTIGGPVAHVSLKLHQNARETGATHHGLAVQEILQQLPRRNRLLVRLRIDGFTVNDIAIIAGRSKRSVERVIHDTRQMLSELLRKVD